MSLHLMSLLGTLGRWLGGIAAHLIALVLAPVSDAVRLRLYPPDRLDIEIYYLSTEIETLAKQIELLRTGYVPPKRKYKVD